MLIKSQDLKKIAGGTVSLAFRKWKRPTVKTGGTLRTVVGVLAIDSVKEITKSKITLIDARQAGFETRQQLLEALETQKGDGQIYRIELRLVGEDPRINLRAENRLTAKNADGIRRQLQKYDANSRIGPWTNRVLREIKRSPGLPAADLAGRLKLEKGWLKRNIRKLKEVGLTESLSTGYRLSPRGEAFLEVP